LDGKCFVDLKENTLPVDSKKKKNFLTLIYNKKKSKSKIKKSNVEFKYQIPSSNFSEPIKVRMNENWVDITSKYSALAAVILAFVTVIFDCSQSKKQDEAFNRFQTKLDSTLTIQLENAKIQHERTISLMKEQQESMQQQNDSTIRLLKIQADRLMIQNEIWKIDQKNKILNERASILEYKKEISIRNDSIHLVLFRENKGKRPAKIVNAKNGIIHLHDNKAELIFEITIDNKIYEILPSAYREMYIDFSFHSIYPNDKFILYSMFEYEDEMFEKPFIVSNFFKLEINNGNISFYNCTKNDVEITEKDTKIKDIDFSDYTIKKEFISR
jgi:hypothetical protein